ncbi:PTS system mannose/fructose/sorbose family transporter subunit IID [Desulfovibrio sp. OttesenSCG-928-F07]|nr:PTS system mannose/fructose/sorbose family transporter subunit IID [Desulfovibrio sp. OttesenSCG-928-F07]
MHQLSKKTYRRCLIRSSMLNFMYTAQGLQSIGFLYGIMPGLREIHTNDEAFAKSCARYSRHFNCNIFWAPFLTGAFLHLEQQIAAGAMSSDYVGPLKDTALNTLSAVGDSFFSGSLLITQVLIIVCLIALNSIPAAFIAALIWLLLSFILKFAAFNIGLARGMSVLRHIRRLNLVNKGDYLKLFNAVLLAATLTLFTGISPELALQPLGLKMVSEVWLMPLGITFLLAYAASRLHISRSLATIAILAVASIII